MEYLRCGNLTVLETIFSFYWGKWQKNSNLDFSHIIQNPILEMDVELRFCIKKRIQLKNGQIFEADIVCGELEVFTKIWRYLKILNNKQKIFWNGQITLLTHLIDDPNINVPWAIFIDLWQFSFFAGKKAQNVISAFSNQHIKYDKK